MFERTRFCVGKFLRMFVVEQREYHSGFKNFLSIITKPMVWVADAVAPITIGNDYRILKTALKIKSGEDAGIFPRMFPLIEHVGDIPTGGPELSDIYNRATDKMSLPPRAKPNIMGLEGRAITEMWVNEHKKIAKRLPDVPSKVESFDKPEESKNV